MDYLRALKNEDISVILKSIDDRMPKFEHKPLQLGKLKALKGLLFWNQGKKYSAVEVFLEIIHMDPTTNLEKYLGVRSFLLLQDFPIIFGVIISYWQCSAVNAYFIITGCAQRKT
jgi:hypothetical protein